MGEKQKYNRAHIEAFYALQNGLTKSIFLTESQIQTHLLKKSLYYSPTKYNYESKIGRTLFSIQEKGYCGDIYQEGYIWGGDLSQPHIRLTEKFKDRSLKTQLYILIDEKESASTGNIQFEHKISSKGEIRNILTIGLRSQNIEEKIRNFFESQQYELQSLSKLFSGSGLWSLSYEGGLWYIKKDKTNLNYPITDDALKDMGIDSIPENIYLGDPGIKPITFSVTIGGKKVELTYPSPGFSKRTGSIGERALEGKLMVPIEIKVDGKVKRFN